MPTTKGKAGVDRFFAALPEELAGKVLVGAARAGGNVIADEAKVRSISSDVDEAINVRVKRDDGRIVVRVGLKAGWGRSVGAWLEYGTSPHFISVDPDLSGGRTAGRVNRLDRQAARDGRSGPGASLVINGKFVGETVFHPGARPHPFLRPALDTKRDEAIAAAQGYINVRVARMNKGEALPTEAAEG